MKPILVLTTTVENKKDAERIAELLLGRRLIACAQISGPMTSFYRWKGETTSSTEFMLSLKTTLACVGTVKAMVMKEHPYDLPEIIVQQIDNSSVEYSNWVYGEVQQ